MLICTLWNRKMINTVESKIWLDDIRDPRIFVSEDCYEDGWIWVKTVEEAIGLLKHRHIVYASLDNDLGINGITGKFHTEGYKLVDWMEENDTWPRDGVAVHSSNPVAVQRMNQIIERNYENQEF